ncbi:MULTISPECIES: RimK family alpha-L-glutamate ligase [Metallosphaera]|uniref:ATP-grasp domain-containing protein n=1 Tax=Metallosphaera TaxID=41980 RepID=UPI002200E469|nr:RimK family alpha-L-glutamate ligase [Metallosphaera sedula]BBL46703.1 tetrahydromethanopterin:alpha-L-glutamate ligase [Metallosphaera sedula]
MAKIAVVHESQKVTEASKQLLLEIKARGHTAYYIRVSRINSSIGEDLGISYAGKKLEIDGALIRNLGFLTTIEQMIRRVDVLREIESRGVVTMNNVGSMLLARDKYASISRLHKAGIPVPYTALVEDPFEVMRLVEEWGEVVIKPLVGSLGLGSVKVSDPDIAFRVAKSILSVNQPVYVQKYVKKPNRDIRAFVVGDRLLGSIYRISQENWKTNVAQGALVQAISSADLKEIEEISVKATKALGLDYSGVDIVEDLEGGYKVLEVNGAPMWKGFQTATSLNPAKYIVNLLLEKIRK